MLTQQSSNLVTSVYDTEDDAPCITRSAARQAEHRERIDDEIEHLVRGIWERVLQISPIGRDQSYHDLSRGVRRAIVILQEIEAAIGVELPMSLFSTAPTISGMTAAILDPEAAPFSPLVLIKEGYGPRPLVMLPGIGGLVFELFELTRSLSYPGDIYGLQSIGLDARDAPKYSIVEMAVANVEAIRTVQSRGPYTIVGYCLGGCIALEMARLLSDAGEEILGLIEPPLQEKAWPLPTWINFTLSRTIEKTYSRLMRPQSGARRPEKTQSREFLAREWQHVPPDRSVYAGHWSKKISWTNLPGAKSFYNSLVQRFQDPGKPGFALTSHFYIGGLPSVFQELRDAGILSFATYIPSEYKGMAIYFRTPIGNTLLCDPRKVWPRVIPDLEWCNITGDHQSLLRPPHVAVLAERLSARLTDQQRS